MIFFILIVSFIVFIDASGFALSKHLMTLLYSTDLKEKENNIDLEEERSPEVMAEEAVDYIFGGDTFEDTQK